MPTWADDLANRDSPQSAFSAAVATNIRLSGACRVYGFTVYSSKASSQFILMFDASSLPAEGAVPIVALPVATVSQVAAYFGPMGRVFTRGLVLCNSSTDVTKTLGSADCLFDVQLDYLV